MTTNTIFVPLLGEGTAVWRPVKAELLSLATYRIVGESAHHDEETWAYQTGQIVSVEQRTFQDGTRGFAAVGEGARVRLDLTSEEVNIIQNALNEVCNGVDFGTEFETRMGATLSGARELLKRVATLSGL
jgi:hypothetical protein